MLICPNATKTFVNTYVKRLLLNYTKYFLRCGKPAFGAAGKGRRAGKGFRNACSRARNPAKFRAICEKNGGFYPDYETFFHKLAKNTCKIPDDSVE